MGPVMERAAIEHGQGGGEDTGEICYSYRKPPSSDSASCGSVAAENVENKITKKRCTSTGVFKKKVPPGGLRFSRRDRPLVHGKSTLVYARSHHYQLPLFDLVQHLDLRNTLHLHRIQEALLTGMDHQRA